MQEKILTVTNMVGGQGEMEQIPQSKGLIMDFSIDRQEFTKDQTMQN